jgi:mRNA-degrading endonuclease RelE of RelBE toxin-antitoxin system
MYQVRIDELVLKKDFKKIDLRNQIRIIKAIRQKLTTKPKEFGRPLRGEFRVIYEVLEAEILVTIILVGFRRDEEAYRSALSRLYPEYR